MSKRSQAELLTGLSCDSDIGVFTAELTSM